MVSVCCTHAIFCCLHIRWLHGVTPRSCVCSHAVPVPPHLPHCVSLHYCTCMYLHSNQPSLLCGLFCTHKLPVVFDGCEY
jgi:hypothetical protein